MSDEPTNVDPAAEPAPTDAAPEETPAPADEAAPQPEETPAADAPASDEPVSDGETPSEREPDASRTGFAEKGLKAGDACTCPDGRAGTVHRFDAGLICIPNQG